MIRKVRYQSSRLRKQLNPRQDDEEFFWPGERVTIEVWDHPEEEIEEDTGLLDQHGQPIIRITHIVPHPIGFIWPDNDE